MSEEFVDDIISSIPTEGTAQEVASLEAQAMEETVPVVDRVPVSAPTSAELTAEIDNAPAQEAPIIPETIDKVTDVTSVVPSDPAIEALAKQLGWRPEHIGETFVDASTYILKSRDIQDSMKDHNRELKNQLTDMKSSIDSLQLHNERVYKAEVTRLESELADLTKKKNEAIEIGDVAEVNNLDSQINSVKTTIAEPIPVPKTTTSNPVYDEWVADNKWYVEDKDMAAYADQVAQQYSGAPADRIYAVVRNKVSELWPEKFELVPAPGDATTLQAAVVLADQIVTKATPIAPAGPVEGGHTQPTPATFTKTDLTPSQQNMMQQFSKLGIMTEDQYIADIAKLQGES